MKIMTNKSITFKVYTRSISNQKNTWINILSGWNKNLNKNFSIKNSRHYVLVTKPIGEVHIQQVKARKNHQILLVTIFVMPAESLPVGTDSSLVWPSKESSPIWAPLFIVSEVDWVRLLVSTASRPLYEVRLFRTTSRSSALRWVVGWFFQIKNLLYWLFNSLFLLKESFLIVVLLSQTSSSSMD